MVVVRRDRVRPRAANEVWSLDFVSDQLANGTRFRALTAVDVFSREALAIELGQHLGGEHLVAVLNRLVAQRQAPNYLFVDNGSELSSRLLDLCAYHCKVRIDFGRPRQTDRQLLRRNFQRFVSRRVPERALVRNDGDTKVIVEAWRRDYNETRPHLNNIAPLHALAAGSLPIPRYRY